MIESTTDIKQQNKPALLTPKCWAFQLPMEKIEAAKRWFHELNTERYDEMQQHMQRWGMTNYKAWLQTTNQGAWIVEYWITPPESGEEIKAKLDSQSYPFLDWCLEWKKDLHDGQFDSFKGLRHLIEYEAPNLIANQQHDEVLASVIPILPGKLQQCIATIDDWERNQKDAMDAYCTRMGVQKWHAWIEELDNENYLVQYHVLRQHDDMEDFYEHYQQDVSDYAEQVRQFGIACCGVDFREEQDWQHLEELCNIKNENIK